MSAVPYPLPLSPSLPLQSKKSRETMSVTTPTLTSALDLHATPTSPPPTKSYPIPDYEELGDCKTPPSGHMAVPNEYVPSPQEMEQFRRRVYTVGVCQPTPTEIPLRRLLPEGFSRRDSMATNTTTTSDEDTRSNTSSGVHKSHHLSVISMESGLSFGYDVDINPSLPLEVQPWFHGKLSREDASALLRDEGDFLVRENTAVANTYTLSMHWRAQSDHTLIQCDEVVNSRNGTTVKYSFDGGAFDSIPELIYHHLKYQIPIDRDTHNLLMTPIHRPGARVPFAPASYYQQHTHPSERGPHTGGHSSPSYPRGDDNITRSEVARVPHHHPLRSTSMSPGASSVTSSSARPSPGRDFAARCSNSSGDLIETDGVGHAAAVQRNAVSPPPGVGGAPVMMRSRAMTDSRIIKRTSSAGVRNSKRDSFGDYEVMESVSLLGSPPTQRKECPHSGSPSPAPGNIPPADDVKYAEIRHLNKPRELMRRDTYSGPQHSGVKYAEVRFTRKQHSQPSVSPHPFSLYDTIQSSGQQARVSPYQSRAEVLAQRLQSDSPPRSSPSPSSSSSSSTAHPRLNRMESSPHPYPSRYSTHSLPRHTSSPLVMDGISEEAAPNQTPPHPQQQPDGKMHSLPDRTRRRVHAPHEAPRSGLATEGHSVGKRGGLSAPDRVPKSLPGYEMLVSLHEMLSCSSDVELASHLTRADAVAFLLTPRPGEDKEVWKER